MNYTLAYIDSASLPAPVREITAFDTTVFQVVMENKHEYILIKADSNGIEEIERLKK